MNVHRNRSMNTCTRVYGYMYIRLHAPWCFYHVIHCLVLLASLVAILVLDHSYWSCKGHTLRKLQTAADFRLCFFLDVSLILVDVNGAKKLLVHWFRATRWFMVDFHRPTWSPRTFGKELGGRSFSAPSVQVIQHTTGRFQLLKGISPF